MEDLSLTHELFLRLHISATLNKPKVFIDFSRSQRKPKAGKITRLGAILDHLGGILAQLGAILADLGAILAHLGADLGSSCASLGSSWAYLGLSWRILGASCDRSRKK